jgi:hypothetical protein
VCVYFCDVKGRVCVCVFTSVMWKVGNQPENQSIKKLYQDKQEWKRSYQKKIGQTVSQEWTEAEFSTTASDRMIGRW